MPISQTNRPLRSESCPGISSLTSGAAKLIDASARQTSTPDPTQPRSSMVDPFEGIDDFAISKWFPNSTTPGTTGQERPATATQFDAATKTETTAAHSDPQKIEAFIKKIDAMYDADKGINLAPPPTSAPAKAADNPPLRDFFASRVKGVIDKQEPDEQSSALLDSTLYNLDIANYSAIDNADFEKISVECMYDLATKLPETGNIKKEDIHGIIKDYYVEKISGKLNSAFKEKIDSLTKTDTDHKEKRDRIEQFGRNFIDDYRAIIKQRFSASAKTGTQQDLRTSMASDLKEKGIFDDDLNVKFPEFNEFVDKFTALPTGSAPTAQGTHDDPLSAGTNISSDSLNAAGMREIQTPPASGLKSPTVGQVTETSQATPERTLDVDACYDALERLGSFVNSEEEAFLPTEDEKKALLPLLKDVPGPVSNKHLALGKAWNDFKDRLDEPPSLQAPPQASVPAKTAHARQTTKAAEGPSASESTPLLEEHAERSDGTASAGAGKGWWQAIKDAFSRFVSFFSRSDKLKEGDKKDKLTDPAHLPDIEDKDKPLFSLEKDVSEADAQLPDHNKKKQMLDDFIEYLPGFIEELKLQKRYPPQPTA